MFIFRLMSKSDKSCMSTPNSKLFATHGDQDVVDKPARVVRNYMKSSIVFDDQHSEGRNVVPRPGSNASDYSSNETASTDGDNGVHRSWTPGMASPVPSPSQIMPATPAAPPATPVGKPAAGLASRQTPASTGRARIPPGGHSQKFW